MFKFFTLLILVDLFRLTEEMRAYNPSQQVGWTLDRPIKGTKCSQLRLATSKRDLKPFTCFASASTKEAVYGKDAPRRVVVTGHGVVSSLGHDPHEFYSNLLAGKSGISLIESFDACTLLLLNFIAF